MHAGTPALVAPLVASLVSRATTNVTRLAALRASVRLKRDCGPDGLHRSGRSRISAVAHSGGP